MVYTSRPYIFHALNSRFCFYYNSNYLEINKPVRNMSRMDFDTKTVVFKKNIKEKQIHKEIQKTISQKSHEQKRLERVENDEIVIETPSTEFKKALQQARMKHGMSQRDLAQRMNIKPNKITEWEQGKIKPNPSERSNLQRVLNTKLPK